MWIVRPEREAVHRSASGQPAHPRPNRAMCPSLINHHHRDPVTGGAGDRAGVEIDRSRASDGRASISTVGNDADELGRARERLAVLDRERVSLLATIRELESSAAGPEIATAEGRVRLFASLFRGRDDVFATRWESRTQPGRSGWAPRCSNEWRPGLCLKPKVKCAACEHRRFLPLTELELRGHLEGRQTIGIYPLLVDETCRLVVVDLDGATWREDATAVRGAADRLGVPVLVERSRSGDGAHVWVLLDDAVRASVARAVGTRLLTEAMSKRTISMASYDRLFPSQDTMPAGGFGNLIALPLQRPRRADGCTEFLDEDLEPFADQWAYLAQARRLAADRAAELAAESEQNGSRALPAWQPVVEPQQPRLSIGAAATTVSARLAGRLEIDTRALGADLRQRLRRVAAFANPTFFERERARLSTHRTPRVIVCHEDRGDVVLLPRGCVERAQGELASAGVDLAIDDQRVDGAALDVSFAGSLGAGQRRAVAALEAHETGVLVAPPGAGKTVMAAALIARRGRSTLVVVHRRPLLEQWHSRLAEFLDLHPRAIGSPEKPGAAGIDLAMIQGLARRNGEEWRERYGHVVVDECHHVPAVTAERVLRALPARFVLGLTATPVRRDGHHPIIEMQCGPRRHVMAATVERETAVRRVLCERRSTFDIAALPPDPGIQEILGAVAADARRTARIAADVLDEIAQGRFPLVLTERRSHLDALVAHLQLEAEVVCLHGGLGVKARRRADAVLASSAPRVVVAIGRYIGEGFDDPRLDTLVLAMPIAWKGTMTQYAGRLHRHHDDKREMRIIDYVDHDVPVLRRMYAKRQHAYASLGYRPG